MAEGAALLVVSLIAYSSTEHAWWLVPALILLPDVFMGGYLHSTQLGAHVYNVAHATILPAVMVGTGWWAGNSWAMAIGLIWLAHIGMDRSLAFGLKYDDHIQHTHMSGAQRVGALQPTAIPGDPARLIAETRRVTATATNSPRIEVRSERA
jgi:hypothetical protein